MITPGPFRRDQRGITLIVVLLLLLVMTLLGLASLRGTLLEERMSAATYDRGIAFQQAETALREAEAKIAEAGTKNQSVGFDCAAVGVICSAVPANAYSGNVAGCGANAQNCWINATGSALKSASGRPQYYIEYMAQANTADGDQLGFETSANALQYGGAGGVPLSRFYRLTARSSDPSTTSNRAIVVLQSTMERK